MLKWRKNAAVSMAFLLLLSGMPEEAVTAQGGTEVLNNDFEGTDKGSNAEWGGKNANCYQGFIRDTDCSANSDS